jgi:16S rRNA (adenine1518-N6/adenine1519-N6)-dimethyltransferase
MNLSQLKDLLSSQQFYPSKRLGQNFLIDQNIQQKIIQSCQIKSDDFVLEIGAGLGALTADLALSCRELVALEVDKRFIPILKEKLANRPKAKVLEEDILKIKLRKVFRNLAGHKIKVVGNLPYYITTPVIFHLLEQKDVINYIFITIQKEIGTRILAKPGRKDYGRLSVGVQYLTWPKLLFYIPKSAFYPQPKVDSSFLKLSIKDNPQPRVVDLNLFFNLVENSFNQRRKIILNSLADKRRIFLTKEELLAIFTQAKIDPTRRPETLSIDEFGRLSNIISAKG